MAWQPTAYTLVALVAAGLSGVVAALAWRRRSEPAAGAFVRLVLALGGWALVYGVQLGFDSAETQTLLQGVAFAVGGTVPALWFLFVARYTARDAWLTRPVVAVLVLEPIAVGALSLTNAVHGLVWTDAWLVSEFGWPVLQLSLGPGYVAHIAFAYLLVGAGIGHLIADVTRSNLHRRQTAVLVAGSLPPFVTNVAYTLGVEAGGLRALDPTPFTFVVTSAVFGVAAYRYDLLERAPIARERILTETNDGYLVLDEDGTVIDCNETARRALGATETARWPPDGADRHEARDGEWDDPSALDGRRVTTTHDGRERAYELTGSVLRDRHGRLVGHVIECQDVTEQHAFEQRLEVANRALRHNLRTELSLVRGWAEEIAATGPPELTETAERIVERTEEMAGLSEKTRTMVSTSRYVGEPRQPVDVGQHLEPLLDTFGRLHPNATIETDIPAGVEVAVPEPGALTAPIESIVENAIEHNDRAEPWLEIAVEPPDGSGDDVTIRVTDDGPGIPELERAVIREGSETKLRHGSGVGLWLAYWSVRAAGGRIGFDADNDRGSTVTLYFPAPSDPTDTASARSGGDGEVTGR